AQCEAWISAADDEAAFSKTLLDELTLLATVNRQAVGFASLRDNAHLNMLYVQPTLVRRGIATALVDALETVAASRGTSVMTTDASDTARDFFASRGYVAMRRNTIEIAGEWLGNTSMEKKLTRPQRGALQ
ncbi:MAG: GNAT family N-acetyltransferase, partial [Alphaproteobacteria bacterium]|nr:GNAT family N-acetyltransferase [Alphaproteobacteria bacterium]